jgi:glycine hydroxymethyltransferase
VENAAALADNLMSKGYQLVSGGTDNHLMLVDLRANLPDMTGAQAESRLETANIIVNKNLIPFDQRKPMQTSGIRIGTPAVTTRGMKADDMAKIADWIDQTLKADSLENIEAKIKPQVLEFAKQFPIYPD